MDIMLAVSYSVNISKDLFFLPGECGGKRRDDRAVGKAVSKGNCIDSECGCTKRTFRFMTMCP